MTEEEDLNTSILLCGLFQESTREKQMYFIDASFSAFICSALNESIISKFIFYQTSQSTRVPGTQSTCRAPELKQGNVVIRYVNVMRDA